LLTFEHPQGFAVKTMAANLILPSDTLAELYKQGPDT